MNPRLVNPLGEPFSADRELSRPQQRQQENFPYNYNMKRILGKMLRILFMFHEMENDWGGRRDNRGTLTIDETRQGDERVEDGIDSARRGGERQKQART